MRVLVVGAGKMVTAIVKGLPSEVVSDWGIFSKTGTSARDLAKDCGANFVEKLEDFKADWILLGIKPQQLRDVSLPDLPVMSLLAAISEEAQKSILGVKTLVRVMPNLPVRYRQGVTLLSSSKKDALKFPEEVFSKLGLAQSMDEKELEELTLLTGSGPALFYEFAKTLAGTFQSLSVDEREVMVRAVLQGSAASLKEENLETMINAVTSKGGVTIAVLEEWRKQNLSGVLKAGVESGMERTQVLKALLLQK